MRSRKTLVRIFSIFWIVTCVMKVSLGKWKRKLQQINPIPSFLMIQSVRIRVLTGSPNPLKRFFFLTSMNLKLPHRVHANENFLSGTALCLRSMKRAQKSSLCTFTYSPVFNKTFQLQLHGWHHSKHY